MVRTRGLWIAALVLMSSRMLSAQDLTEGREVLARLMFVSCRSPCLSWTCPFVDLPVVDLAFVDLRLA